MKRTTIKRDGKLTLTPQLRFPEFVGQLWRDVRLQDVTAECTTRNGKDLSSESVMGVTKAEGIIPMQERLIGADISRYKLVQRNWFAYNPMRLNIGSIARWPNDSDILVSPDYVVFRCLEEPASAIDPEYLDHFRRSGQWEYFVTESGIGSVRVRIYYSDIARLQLKLPPPAEQKKIAECLSSVDDLIAAQARKLDALKTHKKGLMQQLFPREGETQPRRRFPEFQDAGEWTVEPFQMLYEFKPTNTYSRDQLNYDSGTVKNIHYGDIHTKFATAFRIEAELVPFVNASESLMKVKSDAYCKEGDMIFADASEDLADVGKSIEIVDLNGEKVLSGSHTILARQKRSALVTGFAGYLFKSRGIRAQIEKEAQGTKVMAISTGRLAGITVCFPPDRDEQENIADCVSSLDDLIFAQTKNLDALKTHKKGLMQQLFSSPEEVEA